MRLHEFMSLIQQQHAINRMLAALDMPRQDSQPLTEEEAFMRLWDIQNLSHTDWWIKKEKERLAAEFILEYDVSTHM